MKQRHTRRVRRDERIAATYRRHPQLRSVQPFLPMVKWGSPKAREAKPCLIYTFDWFSMPNS